MKLSSSTEMMNDWISKFQAITKILTSRMMMDSNNDDSDNENHGSPKVVIEPKPAEKRKFKGRLEVKQNDETDPIITPSTTRSGFQFGNLFQNFVNVAILCDEDFAFKCDATRTLEDPVTPDDIKGRPDEKLWIATMNDEIVSLNENITWSLVPRPQSQVPIKCRWIFKTKHTAEGKLDKYKALLAANGCTQRYGLDYKETFAPVVRYSSIRILVAIAVTRNMQIHHMDVKTAFLNGEVEENILMEQPPGFEDGTGRVCKLQTSIYGLKQAGRNWNKNSITS